MATQTYLEMVNEVLVRLRENEVTSVSDNKYSKLVGKFINDTKRQVEDAWNWNALRTYKTFTTSADTTSYSITDIGTRFKVIDVENTTKNVPVEYVETLTLNNWYLNPTPQKGVTQYYNFNGVDTNGDTKVTVYPIPDASYTIKVNCIVPSASLTSNADTVNIPTEPLILGAYARALAERGEDGGMASSEAYQLFKSCLADYIAIEANRYPDTIEWSAD